MCLPLSGAGCMLLGAVRGGSWAAGAVGIWGGGDTPGLSYDSLLLGA